jgi:phage baseplate assembly protein W
VNIDFPFRVDDRGRTAEAGADDHIRQMIELLVLTNPGERVNRPTFGAGLQQMVFAPNSPELAAALQFLVQGALAQHLGDLISVQTVDVTAEDATLAVAIAYVVNRTRQPATLTVVLG